MGGKRERILQRWRATRAWELPGFQGSDPPTQMEALAAKKTFTPGNRGLVGADSPSPEEVVRAKINCGNNVAVLFAAMHHYRAHFGAGIFWTAVDKAVCFPIAVSGYQVVVEYLTGARRVYIAANGADAPSYTAHLVDEWIAMTEQFPEGPRFQASSVEGPMPTLKALDDGWRALRDSKRLQNLGTMPLPACKHFSDVEEGEIVPEDHALIAAVVPLGAEGGRSGSPPARPSPPQPRAVKRVGSPLEGPTINLKRRAGSLPAIDAIVQEGLPNSSAAPHKQHGSVPRDMMRCWVLSTP